MKQEIDSSGEGGKCGEHLGKTATTHLACEFACEPNQSSPGDRRQQPQTNQRTAKNMTSEPGNQGDGGRLVHVAPIKVLGAGEVIKFITKDSITPGGDEVQQ